MLVKDPVNAYSSVNDVLYLYYRVTDMLSINLALPR